MPGAWAPAATKQPWLTQWWGGGGGPLQTNAICQVAAGHVNEGISPNVTTSAYVPGANELLLAVVDAAVSSGTAPSDPVSVSGWGLTWGRIGSIFTNNVFTLRHRAIVYVARTFAAPASDVFTVTNVGVNAEIQATVFKIQHAKLGADGLASIVQSGFVNQDGGIV